MGTLKIVLWREWVDGIDWVGECSCWSSGWGRLCTERIALRGSVGVGEERRRRNGGSIRAGVGEQRRRRIGSGSGICGGCGICGGVGRCWIAVAE